MFSILRAYFYPKQTTTRPVTTPQSYSCSPIINYQKFIYSRVFSTFSTVRFCFLLYTALFDTLYLLVIAFVFLIKYSSLENLLINCRSHGHGHGHGHSHGHGHGHGHTVTVTIKCNLFICQI